MISKKLDEYFKKMDKEPHSSDNCSFNSRNDKEMYESYLNFALFRLNAAEYHLSNVKSLKENELKKAEKFHSISNINGVTFKYKAVNQGFSYELSSFLTSIRSSIDFLVVPSSYHIKGLNLDSVRVLIKGLNKNEEQKKMPIYRIIYKHLKWIEFLKEYRDRLVHKSVISINVGYEISSKMSDIAHYPLTVPRTPPRFMKDTRMSRAFYDQSFDHDSTFSELTVTLEGKTKEKTVTKSFYPSFDRIEIIEFMNIQLEHLKNFFIEMIDEYEGLEFKKIDPLNK